MGLLHWELVHGCKRVKVCAWGDVGWGNVVLILPHRVLYHRRGGHHHPNVGLLLVGGGGGRVDLQRLKVNCSVTGNTHPRRRGQKGNVARFFNHKENDANMIPSFSGVRGRKHLVSFGVSTSPIQ